MAELAFAIIEKVLEKLGPVAYQELSLAWGVKSDLKRLERTMSIIKEVLLIKSIELYSSTKGTLREEVCSRLIKPTTQVYLGNVRLLTAPGYQKEASN